MDSQWILAMLFVATCINLFWTFQTRRKIMSTTPVTREQLDAALDAAVSTITTAIDDLLAKIQAGQVTTPEDFTAEVQKLQAIANAAQASDPGPQPPAGS